MFCIKDGELKIAPYPVSKSHIEWFEDEGWVNKENEVSFLEETIRGYYFVPNNSIYAYRGTGFLFDDNLIEILKTKLSELKSKFKLNDKTQVVVGPKDSFLGQQRFIGTVEQLVGED